MSTEVDALIIGAGPVGLRAAYFPGFRELSTAVVDSLPESGGQVSALYPEKLIYDISTGIGPFVPRPLPFDGDFEGCSLSHFVPQPAEYVGKDLVVVGGGSGDSAVDKALTLRDIARHVTLVRRRDNFRGEHNARRLRESGAEIRVPHVVSDVSGGSSLDEVGIVHTQSKQMRTPRCQNVVTALGSTANFSALESWGLAIGSRRVLVNRMQTNMPLVYLAGNIADCRGAVRLTTVGFGEVAIAVNSAAVNIDPDCELFPGHSTNNSVLEGQRNISPSSVDRAQTSRTGPASRNVLSTASARGIESSTSIQLDESSVVRVSPCVRSKPSRCPTKKTVLVSSTRTTRPRRALRQSRRRRQGRTYRR